MDLTPKELDLLPSSDDIAQFKQLGWYSSPVILPTDVISEAIIGAEELMSGHSECRLPNVPQVATNQDCSLINIEFAYLHNEKIRRLVNHPLISATASRLNGAHQLRLFSDSLLCKMPAGQNQADIESENNVGWHTDKAYWPTCTSENMLTAWVPLEDCTIDMGPVIYIDGSHTWDRNAELKQMISFNHNNEQFEALIRRSGLKIKKSYMTLKKGQVSFHHCRLLHGSQNNTSKCRRIAIAIHLQDGDNLYQTIHDKDGKKIEIGYDRICAKDAHGQPNYQDAQLFPIIFNA